MFVHLPPPSRLQGPARRLLKNSRMPRCRQFSEDRKEPSADLRGLRGPHLPASRSATGKLGDIARAENWRNLGGKKGSHPFLGVSSLGHHGRVRGPFPSRASLLSHSPFRGCSFVPPPISAPNSSRVTCVGFQQSPNSVSLQKPTNKLNAKSCSRQSL
jgi:hypothetical protein